MIRVALGWIGRVIAEVWSGWHRHRCTQLGAAISFYGIFSLIPLLLLMTSAFGYLLAFWPGAAMFKDSVSQLIADGASPQVARITMGALTATEAARGQLGLIAVFLLLFAASGIFVHLEVAVQVVWDLHVVDKPFPFRVQVLRFLRTRLASFLLVAGVGLLIFLSLVVDIVLDALAHKALNGLRVNWRLLELAMGFFASGWIVTILFRLLPARKVPWRAALIGGWLTAALWEVAKQGLSSFLRGKDYANAYPILGSAFAVLVWVYFGALVFLLGAETASAITRLLVARRQQMTDMT
jgi:membrane protein